MKAKQQAKADGHVAVAREVIVNLDGEGGGVEQGKQRCLLARAAVEAAQLAHGVGHQHLFGKPDNKAPGAGRDLVKGGAALLQLEGDVAVAHDGAGHKLREQADKGPHGDKVFLRMHPAPVDVDGIAHGLEGEKADADGERDLEQGDGGVQQAVDR